MLLKLVLRPFTTTKYVSVLVSLEISFQRTMIAIQ